MENSYLPLTYECHWANYEIATTNKRGFFLHKFLKTSKFQRFLLRYWWFIWIWACFTIITGRLAGLWTAQRPISFGMCEKERYRHYSLPKSHRICQNLQLNSLFRYVCSNTKKYKYQVKVSTYSSSSHLKCAREFNCCITWKCIYVYNQTPPTNKWKWQLKSN